MRTVVALLLFAQAASAHELGRFQVQAEFLEDGTYRVDLVADEEHLTPQLLRTLADGATIAFDGRPVEPKVELVPPGPETPPGRTTFRLHGPIPGGARAFTWRESVKLGSYPLIPKNEGDESTVWQWLEGDATSQPFRLAVSAASVVPPTRMEIAGLYLKLGFTHILPKGLDHILFVLGLFLLSRKARPLLRQVTSFTIAHTVTLALSIYGLISLPSSIVEPLIALSIVFVAVENILTSELRPSRIALVFAFGLLHGLGFAGVLTELGLPRSEFLPALISFNLGVETGQLAVIGLAFLAVGLFRNRAWYRQAVVVPASCAIAAVGVYWSIQRTFF
jgi:hydrogenase/urease accessory protein HupE